MLSKLGVDDFCLRTFELPRNQIIQIKQAPAMVNGAMEEIFEQLSEQEFTMEQVCHFLIPKADKALLIRLDMGEEFVEQNCYKGTSVRGSEEDILYELEDFYGLSEMNKPAYMLQNVDIYEALSGIVEKNTLIYKDKLSRDIQTMKDALEQGISSRYFWISKDCGTRIFSEQDIYLKDTPIYSEWAIDGGERGARSYFIELNGQEEGRLKGTICELDHLNHLDFIDINFKRPVSVTVDFQLGDQQIFSFSRYRANSNEIREKYGSYGACQYNLENPIEHSDLMGQGRQLISENVKSIALADYLNLVAVKRVENDWCDSMSSYDDLER